VIVRRAPNEQKQGIHGMSDEPTDAKKDKRMTDLERPLFTARNPEYQQHVAQSFACQNAMALIGATLEAVRPGEVHIRLPFAPTITQQHGYIHGGVVGMIADSAAGYAANTLVRPEQSVLTVEYKLNLLAPAKGESLLACGRVLRPGRTLIVTQASVFAVEQGRETLCAVMQQTIMVMTERPEQAPGLAVMA
jgi:uncharacterized protein (TIGR00369 family)